MTKIMGILKEFCREIERDNPFGLVLKGGTALALYHFNHRESEDLDFDVDIRLKEKYPEIEEYFRHIFEKIKKQGLFTEYRITKYDIAATGRFHLKVELKTAKIYYSKIDLEFTDLPPNLVPRGKLHLYPLERMFISKSLTFTHRKEFKDLYDIAYQVQKIDLQNTTKKKEVAELLQKVIATAQGQDNQAMFKLAFRNVDLRFRDVKPSNIDFFVAKTIQNLRKTINMLQS